MHQRLVLPAVMLALLMGCAPSVKESDFLRFQNTLEQHFDTIEKQLQEEKARSAELSASIQTILLMKANQARSVGKESPESGQHLSYLEQQLHSMERQLQGEKTRNAKLSSEIQAILPPKAGQTISVNEVIALPEQYANKDIVLEGLLLSDVYFDKDLGRFVIHGTGISHNIQCFFKRANLDQLSRRMLVGKLPNSRVVIQGRLASSVDGFSKSTGSYFPGGYEFHVEKVLE